MKRVQIILILLLFSFFLNGCTINDTPEVLTFSEAQKIKRKMMNNDNISNIDLILFDKDTERLTIDDCHLYTFLGEYNGAYVCTLTPIYDQGPPAGFDQNIAGYIFSVRLNFQIEVYYKGEFYVLSKAYEDGILSKEDIEKIHQFLQTCYEFFLYLL